MTEHAERIAVHADRFTATLHDAFRRFGAPDGLPSPMLAAIETVPRHRFVHRFRLGDEVVHDADADEASHLATIYSDTVMEHVGADGERLLSTNSQPSYVLWLLHLLGIEPGQRVLEIGSGSGWLAAVIGRLVGPEGSVTGIEILAGLAAQSRIDLAAVGADNVTILTGDAGRGHAASGPFDRVMITAGVWDLPALVFDAVVEGGRVLAPIELRDSRWCHVAALRRHGGRFEAERAIPGGFVPLTGNGQQRARVRVGIADLSLAEGLRRAPRFRRTLPLGAPDRSDAAARDFRAFLGRAEADLVVVAERRDVAPSRGPVFGLADGTGSLALWDAGELRGAGDPSAFRRMLAAHDLWAGLGSPGAASWGLTVVRSGMARPTPERQWIERRGGTDLVWRIRPDPLAG